jgi:hypothetical protein
VIDHYTIYHIGLKDVGMQWRTYGGRGGSGFKPLPGPRKKKENCFTIDDV